MAQWVELNSPITLPSGVRGRNVSTHPRALFILQIKSPRRPKHSTAVTNWLVALMLYPGSGHSNPLLSKGVKSQLAESSSRSDVRRRSSASPLPGTLHSQGPFTRLMLLCVF